MDSRIRVPTNRRRQALGRRHKSSRVTSRTRVNTLIRSLAPTRRRSTSGRASQAASHPPTKTRIATKQTPRSPSRSSRSSMGRISGMGRRRKISFADSWAMAREPDPAFTSGVGPIDTLAVATWYWIVGIPQENPPGRGWGKAPTAGHVTERAPDERARRKRRKRRLRRR